MTHNAENDAVRAEAALVERRAAVMYGDPDHWCRGSGMNRSYWRRQARKALAQERVTPPEGSTDA